MADFIAEYFLNPIRYPTQYAPYNIYNTAVYAVLALVAVYLIFLWLQKNKFAIDSKFFYAIMPFVVLGGILRVAQDGGMLDRTIYFAGLEIHPFVTPGIYFITFAILALVYIGAKALGAKKEKKLYSRVKFIGAVLACATFVWVMRGLGGNVSTEGAAFLFYILLLALVPPLLFELIKRRYNKNAKDEMRRMEQFTVFSQALDGAATFIGVNFAGYGEQHIVANTIFEAFGNPVAFYLIKMVFVIGVVFFVRREVKDRNEHVFLLLLITLFGLAPGIRDALRIFLGV
ncbi:MAG: DUF63 family protein [Candidatus Micrarchaeota archaeon]